MTQNNNLTIKINNIPYNSEKSFTILQLCDYYFINIPRFCYHEKLSIAGNCRMCLVEIEGVKKPMASCALPISTNMNILTKSQLVKKAREGILEFLLANHPLDCPICDQGGECDLQDQSFNFGTDKGRFYELKRAVSDKECGPFIKTIMTRCIHCTRCVRYLKEIAGISQFGVVGRGASMEISNYIKKSILSEISGNVIDLCPVGALTSKPYSFTARSWELDNIDTISLLDPVLPNVRVDLRDRKIMRILPRYNTIIEESWITDVCRFSYDSFLFNRLSFPYIAEKNTYLKKTNWLTIFSKIQPLLKKNNVNFVLGNFLDAETLFLLKSLTKELGNMKITSIASSFFRNIDFRNFYIWNYDKLFFKSYNLFLTLGLNLRYEIPLLNIKLKQIKNKKNFTVICWGNHYNLLYDYYSLGNNTQTLIDLFHGKLKLSKKLINSKIKILNSEYNFKFFNYNSLNLISSKIERVLNKNKYIEIKFSNSILSTPASIMYSELNVLNVCSYLEDFTYNQKILPKCFLYFLNTSNFKLLKTSKNQEMGIYQGHHGIENLNQFDYVLPTTFFLEKNGLYLNNFGELKVSQFTITPPKNSRNDLQILYYLLKFIKNPYDITHNFEFQKILTSIRNQLKAYSPLFSIINSKKKNFFKKNITADIFFDKLFVKKINKFKSNNIGNFLFQNQLTKLSLNLNRANEEQITYYSTFN